MSVTECSVGATRMTIESAISHLKEDDIESKASIDQLRAIAGLCNAAEFDVATMSVPLEDRQIHGDATDQAILRCSESLGSVAKLRNHWKKYFEIAFNSKNKFMVRILSPLDRDSLSRILSKGETEDMQEGDL